MKWHSTGNALETKVATILDFMQGLPGTLALTFEEGTLAEAPCLPADPRKNVLVRDGNQNDRADVRNLTELLRTNQVKAVYGSTDPCLSKSD